MKPANLGTNKNFRKISLVAIGILVLAGIFFGIQAHKEAQVNSSAAKGLTQEEKQKNAEHMTMVTSNICSQFDDVLKEYSDNMDDISYNSEPTENIYNNFKHIESFSKNIQHDAEGIQIIDPRYEEIKTSLIQMAVNIQLSTHHMMDYVTDPKSNADWKAQTEIVNAMLLNTSVKERIATLTQEDGLIKAKN